MTEIRNVAADLARFKRRVVVIGLAVLFAFSLPVSYTHLTLPTILRV